jgi:hypothetical protein
MEFRANDQTPLSAQPDYERTFLHCVNFEMAEIYMPLFIIQINMETFDQRNRTYKTGQAVGMDSGQKEVEDVQIKAGSIEEEYNDY